MSANNWRICPKCLKVQQAKRAAALTKAASVYGKVTAADYTEMIQRANEIPDEPEEETMREDYEIYVDTNGKFAVSYRASCDVCNFDFGFKAEKNALENNGRADCGVIGH